ncbi:MAG: cytochrome c maturation protein CcmE [Methylococcus sp.]|nr:MAG: cytochrome c maturation protein CcmE [Methylococcus sp.]
MKPVRKQRLYLILAMVVAIAVAAGFGLNAFNQNLMFFFAPTEVVAGKAPDTAVFRLGGMVVEGSVQRPGDDLLVRFDLTDFEQVVSVEYTGILPDLFREGQGIVSRGRLRTDGVFVAEEVLAKHDENYMPPEVAASLKRAPEDLK